mgnify:CR=1 FL=1|jgi:hypothetical protein|tara:strand:+ start:416 stop:1024 length:609 start_codon:yes stop_codon:yes gene_type:complete
MALAQAFLDANPEDGDHNQYWYSKITMDRMIQDQVEQHTAAGSPEGGLVIAFLSTPSLYFTLPEEIRLNSYCFDFDQGPNKIWEADRGYVFYDFNKPTELPEHLLGKCDMVVIDPPFIVSEVWMKYAETSKLLLKEGKDDKGVPLGKAVMTTVIENAVLLKEQLGGEPTAFQPSIPNLVYQYNLFTNYPSMTYSTINPEIPQ